MLSKAATSTLLVSAYILCCMRIGARPWNFFKINSRYFCVRRGIFSKLDIDNLVPPAWRLPQQRLCDDPAALTYPVFVKPEWGQNARGIEIAHTPEDLASKAAQLGDEASGYIAQSAASGKREYEIYTINSADRSLTPDLLSVTEVTNSSESRPINSFRNPASRYTDITHQFNQQQKAQLAAYIREIGKFGHCRLCVKADSTSNLLSGDFHFIELNLYTPMPINLLDRNTTLSDQLAFIFKAAHGLARATRYNDNLPGSWRGSVWLRTNLYSYRKKHLEERHRYRDRPADVKQPAPKSQLTRV